MEGQDDKPTNKYRKPMGTYVPPAKRVKSEKFEVGSEEYQRSAWDENKRKITGLINRTSAANVTIIVKELLKCNLIRYKGLFASALLKAQQTSPVFTDVYTTILAVINSRIRTIGILVINRLVLQYQSFYKNNDKSRCLTSIRFVAHLINQEVVHEVLGFELIELLLYKPTPASIEIVIAFLKECGAKLDQLNNTCLFRAFDVLRNLTLEHDLDARTHEMIDLIHVTRKDKFREFPPIKPELDLIDEDDKVTHFVELDGPQRGDFHMEYNYFKFDPKWSENEAKYEEFKRSLLEDGSSSDGSDDATSDGSSDSDENISDDDKHGEKQDDKKDVKPVIKSEDQDVKPEKVVDATGADLIAFRRMVYLTIRSSVRHEEVVHKLLKSKIDKELNDELCQMILDCCGQERTYEAIYGLVASSLCQINKREFSPKFERIFSQFYEAVHRFETNKIRNISKFYAHLLTTESIDWICLSCLKLRENATSSAGRCFIKFIFQEMVSILSIKTLVEYIADPSRGGAFKDLFPKEPEQDVRFAINFFTFSGLGQLTEDLRQVLVALNTTTETT